MWGHVQDELQGLKAAKGEVLTSWKFRRPTPATREPKKQRRYRRQSLEESRRRRYTALCFDAITLGDCIDITERLDMGQCQSSPQFGGRRMERIDQNRTPHMERWQEQAHNLTWRLISEGMNERTILNCDDSESWPCEQCSRRR